MGENQENLPLENEQFINNNSVKEIMKLNIRDEIYLILQLDDQL